ncbi:MAG: integration host factor subunit beta [Deltaproteobacteria bacterium]|nr:MAG: integration host factor subunit beta [Deltaproteobacteria bacterium]
MTKSQLIETVATKLTSIPKKEVEIAVDTIFSCMTDALVRDERIEIRGFGSFVAKTREAREGRNPKTGEKVFVPRKRTPFFTVGKELKERVNGKRLSTPTTT